MKPYYHTSSNEINDGSIGLIYVMYPIISYVYIYILSQPYDINVIYIYVFIDILDDVMYLIIYICNNSSYHTSSNSLFPPKY